MVQDGGGLLAEYLRELHTERIFPVDCDGFARYARTAFPCREIPFFNGKQRWYRDTVRPLAKAQGAFLFCTDTEMIKGDKNYEDL